MVTMSEAFRHLVRIRGTDLEGTKKLAFELSKIRGVGINFANAIVKEANLDPTTLIGHLSEDDVKTLENVLFNPEKYKIPHFLFNRRKDMETGEDRHLLTADLALKSKMDIDFLKEIRCWRGTRHSFGLKVRGQRTRTTGRAGRAVGVKKSAVAAAAAAAAGKEQKKE